ncbi:glycerol-3-phosphate acyltransferase 2, mitochondrial-like [Heliangelus exortis]|uniref:glycerol-3-phosphate acyltransferase 2, mitochondrial-like n=1 Tax=Heliangelus exortis TaxID=472823 RepID=UPI003A943FEC
MSLSPPPGTGGWLVRRVCVFPGNLELENPPGRPPGTSLPESAAAEGCRMLLLAAPREWGIPRRSPQCWEQKIQEILAEIQAPLCPFLLRLCSWALLKLLGRLFLGVQLHRGQLEMVLQAARRPGVPLVFLGRHSSHLDGLLLSSSSSSPGGWGSPGWLWVPGPAAPPLRGGHTHPPLFSPTPPPPSAFLRCLGGIFLPRELEQGAGNGNTELLGAVLAGYVQEVLRSQQPPPHLLEEPPAPRLLSAPAQHWLALVCRALRDGAVPDVLLVPLSVTYEMTPGGLPAGAAPLPPSPSGSGSGLWVGSCAPAGALPVWTFAQPFSLQEFVAKNLVGRRAEELLLLPPILGTCPTSLDTKIPNPGPSTAKEEEEEEEEGVLVTRLGLHALSDAISCSAVMAVAITSALLLHRHPGGVFLSRLLQDFSWLLEELLLHQRDVGFSGRVGVLVWHSLQPLGLLTCHHLGPLGDVLVVPKGSAEARRELGHHSAGHPASAGLGGTGSLCHPGTGAAGSALPGSPPGTPPEHHPEPGGAALQGGWSCWGCCPPHCWGLQVGAGDTGGAVTPLGGSVPPSQPLSPLSAALPAPAQPHPGHGGQTAPLWAAAGQDIERRGCDLSPRVWARVDFSDSDSEEEAPKCCYKLTEPPSCPGLLLFLCRLLAPTLRGIARAATFLGLAPWPLPESDCVEALIQFLQEEESGDLPSRTLALSSLQTFKEMGVLEEVQPPPCPLLHLSPQFQSSANREKLEAFIQQFIQD